MRISNRRYTNDGRTQPPFDNSRLSGLPPPGTHHLLGENHLRDFSIKQDRSSLLGLGEEQLFDRPTLDSVRKHRHRIPIGKEDDPQIRAFAIDELPADKKLPRELNTSGKMRNAAVSRGCEF